MQEKEILEHTRQGLKDMTPDCFDTIWDKASKASPDDYPLPTVPKKRTKKTWIAGFSALAACILCILGFHWYHTFCTVYTTVNLDVNPSVGIYLNRQNIVLSVKGLNADGKSIISDLPQHSYQHIDHVIADTVTQLIAAGYLTETGDNAVLVSVDTPDSKTADTILSDISTQISTSMKQQELCGNIVTQEMEQNDKEVTALSREMHISPGKATLIHSMNQKGTAISEKKLAGMKINEIVDTAQSQHIDISSLEHKPKVLKLKPEATQTASPSPDPKESARPQTSRSPKKETKEPSSRAAEPEPQDTVEKTHADPQPVPKKTSEPEREKDAPKKENRRQPKSTPKPQASEKPAHSASDSLPEEEPAQQPAPVSNENKKEDTAAPTRAPQHTTEPKREEQTKPTPEPTAAPVASATIQPTATAQIPEQKPPHKVPVPAPWIFPCY